MKPRTYYVNREGQGQRETVGEYPPKAKDSQSLPLSQKREALKDCAEYQLADPSARYWVSSRACKDWEQA